jgi:hypothetical protein
MHNYSTAGITSPPELPELRAHYDFNEFVSGQVLDRSGNNRHLTFNSPDSVSGSYASTDFTDTAILSSSTTTSNRIFQFNRSYLTSDGGWLSPSSTRAFEALIVGGGGGAGKPGNPASLTGGSGAGGAVYPIPSLTLPETPIAVVVGQGGLGSNAAAGQGNPGGDSRLGTLLVGGGGGGNSFQYTGTRTVTPGGASYVAGGNGGGGRQDAGTSEESYALGGEAGVAANQVFNGATFTALTGVEGANDYSDSGTGGWGGQSVIRSSAITGTSIEYGKSGPWSAYNPSSNQTLGSGGASNYGYGSGSSADVGGSGRSGVVVLSYQVVPDAPTSVTATSGSIVGLAWTTPTYTGEGSLTDYVIQYRESPSGAWFTFNDGVSTGNSANVTDLLVCKKYDFQVRSEERRVGKECQP